MQARTQSHHAIFPNATHSFAKVHPQATDETRRQGQPCLVLAYHEARGMHEVFFADGQRGFYPEDSLVWE